MSNFYSFFITQDNDSNSDDDDDDVVISSTMMNKQCNPVIERSYSVYNETENIEHDYSMCIIDVEKEKFLRLPNLTREDLNNVVSCFPLCCICGKLEEHHYKERHNFFPTKIEYRCKKCDLYFYQHKHNNKDCCFTPYKYLK